jgi:four helix bundle protein
MQQDLSVSSEPDRFEFQKWPVYVEARAFAVLAQKLCLKLPKTGTQSLGDQFRRASQSIVLNIAEGSTRTTAKDKINFLRIAKGSTFECVAISDLAMDFELLTQEEQQDYQSRLANIGRMLSGMIRYWEKAPERKPSTSYAG